MFDADCHTFESDRDSAATRLSSTRAPAVSDWSSIGLAELATLLGDTLAEQPRFLDIRFAIWRLKAGETLHRAGDKFHAIYAVRSGFLKTVRVDEAGTEQVLAFPMRGDVIGLDGIDPGCYTADVVALDTTHVVTIPFARLSRLGSEDRSIARLLFRLFSRELVREHGQIWLLGSLSADARVASFLLGLSERFGRLGCSRTSFRLRMTRQEIGSYLGMQLETVSRTLSAFSAAGLLTVDGKTIVLRNVAALRRLLEPQDEPDMRPVRRLQRVAA